MRAKLFSLFESGPPAPTAIVHNFEGFDVGAPEGMAPGVNAGEARAVLRQPGADGIEITLYIAPTKMAGFCTATEWRSNPDDRAHRAGAGCRTRDDVDKRPISTSISISGPIDGQEVARDEQSLEFIFIDPLP